MSVNETSKTSLLVKVIYLAPPWLEFIIFLIPTTFKMFSIMILLDKVSDNGRSNIMSANG